MTKNSFVEDVTFKGLSFLHLEIISLFAKLYCTSEEKSFFFLPPKSYEKSNSKLSKYEPECMCKWGWCFEQTIWNNLENGGIEKK